MKADAMTLTVIAFFVGVLMSTSAVTDVFQSEEVAPSGLQAGVVSR